MVIIRTLIPLLEIILYLVICIKLCQMRVLVIIITFLCAVCTAWGNQPVQTRPPANFDTEITRDGIQFTANLPTLNAKVGGREPFYSYLWDFGDGHFSYEANPVHNYKLPGSYVPQLYVVNNYDDGPRPKKGTKKVYLASGANEDISISNDEKHFFSTNGIFQIAKNANALPGEDVTLIVGVKTEVKGRIFLLTNEKEYGQEGLVYVDQTTYFQEKILPAPELSDLSNTFASIQKSTLHYSGSPDYGVKEEKNFKDQEAVRYFSKLYNSYKSIGQYEVQSNDGVAQFSFINLDVTPEMLVDTNAIVTITGIFIPEHSFEAYIHKLEVPIVASHDPNKMSIKKARVNYRTFFKKKEHIYKVQFQNDGEGDAKNVRLEMALPKQADISSFELLHLSPQCEECQSMDDTGCWIVTPKGKDSLVFHFKDISLPGSAAPDVNNMDSTRGFIRFKMKSKIIVDNKKFPARTQIFFDKNEPITTNWATGRYKWNLSPIIFAGYNSFMPDLAKREEGLTHKEYGTFGIGIASIAPYRKPYFQFEIYMNVSEYKQYQFVDSSGTVLLENPPTGFDPFEIEYQSFERNFSARNLNLAIVPLHLRYNFSPFVSAGVGVAAMIKWNLNAQENRKYLPYETALYPSIEEEIKDWHNQPGKDFILKPFFDLNVGMVYLGPSLGLRYHFWGSKQQQLNLYLAWRL